MEYVDENETIVEPEDEDGGWVSTHHTDNTTNQQSTATQEEKTTEIQLDSDKVITAATWDWRTYTYVHSTVTGVTEYNYSVGWTSHSYAA